MHRIIVVAIATCIVFFPREAYVARAPDIVARTVEYRGEAARALVTLLQLPDGATTFELSQADEHRALPARDAALRDPGGFLSSELAWQTSTQIRAVATSKAGVLQLAGYVADLGTASFGAGRPRYAFSSPAFSLAELDRMPGWKRIARALSPLPPVPLSSISDERRLETVLPDGERVVISLVRMDTYNAQNQPVEKYWLSVGFGPTLPGQAITGSQSSGC